MHPPNDSSSNSFRYFVVGVLCAAVLLGIYFVRFNAQVDREREEANQRLALCRQVESVARSVRSNNPETRRVCEGSNDYSAESANQ
jgi:hypothetical protein